jgi:hypothetical protein
MSGGDYGSLSKGSLDCPDRRMNLRGITHRGHHQAFLRCVENLDAVVLALRIHAGTEGKLRAIGKVEVDSTRSLTEV